MIELIPKAELEAIAKILGDTTEGFSGNEISRILADCNMYDPGEITKWRRLYESFCESQNKYNVGSHVGKCIEESMKPVRCLKNKDLWKRRQCDLNQVLSLIGITINELGKLIKTEKSHTIDQALKKTNSLRDKLIQRGVHGEVFKYCTKELIANNYFHAVFESCKGIADRLRNISKVNKDGAELVDFLFSINAPVVAINRLILESEKSEHKGFANLLKGIFGMVRNPLAHDPKLNWDMNEQDALDIFSMISMIHRKIDNMVLVPGVIHMVK
jgi:uncharacterized protein (TIGR02391 family)